MSKPKSKLSKQEKEDIASKIGSEGFDYYFCDYGVDDKLKAIIPDAIRAYTEGKNQLEEQLEALGINWQDF